MSFKNYKKGLKRIEDAALEVPAGARIRGSGFPGIIEAAGNNKLSIEASGLSGLKAATARKLSPRSKVTRARHNWTLGRWPQRLPFNINCKSWAQQWSY